MLARTTKPERLIVRDRLRYGDRHVLDQLGHRRQSAFDRLSDTYSPSTTKSRPCGTESRDHPRGRSLPHRLDTSNEDCLKDRECFRGIGESYDDSFSHSHHDGNLSRHMKRRRDNESPLSSVSKSDSSDERYQKTRSKSQKSIDEDDLTKPWMCEEEDPITPRIRNFKSSRRTRMPNNIKTYDGTGDPEDHVKIFQAIAQKYVKYLVEIHNIKQKDGETIKDFMEQFKVETEGMKGAPECMRIFRFMHEVNNPELTKRLNEHVPKTMEEMMITTTAFIRGEVAAASKKKGHTSLKAHDQSKEQTSEKRYDFRGHQREERGSNRFTPLTRTPKEILAVEAGKFQPPPPMVTPVEKRSSNKFFDFHNDKEHSTDECTQLKKQIEELVRAGKLSHLIKDIKHGRDQSKTGKKETPAKDKLTEIYMIQSCGVEGPLVIEAEMGGHMIHRMYVDGGSSMEIFYEHCFNRLRPKIKNQMVLTTTSLTGFSGETIWPLGQLRLLVTIGNADHFIRAWMNFMIVRSLSPYNGIIGRHRIREIQAVPSTVHGMLKFLVEGGIVTIRSTILILVECTSVITSSAVSKEEGIRPENFKEGYSPVRQKKRGQAPERFKAIQVELAELDEEKTAFHTEQGMYCYTKMPFGLKNAGATYQRLVDKAFNSQIGRNIEVYVDDLVVKSYTEAEMLRDIDETFCTLRKINMKLTLKKCTFGAAEGVFLGYVVTPEGIKPCPDKTAAVLLLSSQRTIKEVQSLNGKLSSLNRFLSKSAEKSLPLFKTLKKCIKKSNFHWTAEAEQAFKQLKHHLSELPLLVAPKPKEELIIYLSATYGAIRPRTKLYSNGKASSVASLRNQETSEVFPSASYHGNQPIKQIMSRPDVAGRLQKWSVMLGEHNITYRPRTSVKGQILADFLTKIPDENPPAAPVAETQQEPWTLFTDGSSCVDGSDAGLILTNPEGIEFTYALRFQFATSNNEAEYEALIDGLRIEAQMGVQNVHVSVDSKLVANQVLGTYVAKEENMIKYLDKVKCLVLVEILKEKSIKEKEVINVVEEDGPTWMTPIVEYLKEGTLPSDRKKERKLRIKARQYELLEGIVYKRSFLTPWLRCVGTLQAEYVIREIHEGSCSMHAGPRSVVAKATWLGYYWPTMHQDARDMIQKCNDFQIHRPGINIAGPLKGPGKVKSLIVAMDYFTKWIEEKAVATITSGQVNKFVWDNIVCRFGLPGEIVSDNGKQFSDNPFKDWCDKLNITQWFASIKHPQSNRLVERANRSFGEGIKARLGEGNTNWVEELPHVLWAHRTMIKSSYDDTPFSLTYGTEAVIPAEIGMPTYRTAAVDVVYNDEELWLNLDLVEERRERAAIREAKAKLKMTHYYNARVHGVTFRPGDFVYRSNDASHAVAVWKLGPKWEGPYEDSETLWSNGWHGYQNSIEPGVMRGANPVCTTYHLALLLLFSTTMLVAMASANNISSLQAQGSVGSRASGYTRIFSWEELGRNSWIHCGASSPVSFSTDSNILYQQNIW
nr:putative reverse transcriptase domain, ribonuclease H-like domain protein [Tanacetum cinerariifolium]